MKKPDQEKWGFDTHTEALRKSSPLFLLISLEMVLLWTFNLSIAQRTVKLLEKRGLIVKEGLLAEYRKNKGPFLENDKVLNGSLQSKMNGNNERMERKILQNHDNKPVTGKIRANKSLLVSFRQTHALQS